MSMTLGFVISISTIMVMWYLALIGVMKEQCLTWRDLFRMILERFGKEDSER